MRRGSPGLVLRPRSAEEASEALLFAREQEVPLAVRSGGHGIGGRSTNDGGVVIDLGRLNQVELLDPSSGRVRLGPGARWGEVAQALAPHGLAISSGDYGDVGVGGLATAGGLGYFARAGGLAIDRVRAAELVLADGSQVRADAETEPDLLWAIRGAGGNFGIVTALEFDAYPLGDVVYSTMLFKGTELPALLERWGDLVAAAPRELTSFLNAFAQGAGGPMVRLTNVYAGDDTEAAVAALRPLLEIGPVLDQRAQLAPYPAIVPASSAPQQSGLDEPLVSNGFATRFGPELGELIDDGLRSGVAPLLTIRSVGGAVNDLDREATAYAHRDANFNVSSALGSSAPEFHRYWDELRPHLDGLYIGFETDPRPQRLDDAFPGATLARLQELKARYDADGIFDQNFPIPPAEPESTARAAVRTP